MSKITVIGIAVVLSLAAVAVIARTEVRTQFGLNKPA